MEASFDYKPLALVIKGRADTNGFIFEQVWRDDSFAIYKKTKGHLEYYEAFKVKKQRAFVLHGNPIEAKEIVPNSEAFGKEAFECRSLDEAKKAIEYLKQMGKLKEAE